MGNPQSNCSNCHRQKHVHEIIGSTGFQDECGDCHNHRFCTVSDEAVYTSDKSDHYHDVRFRTDFADGHYHEFCGKTTRTIDVGDGKHVHYIKAYTTKEDGHKHEFQVASLIDSPTDFKCR